MKLSLILLFLLFSQGFYTRKLDCGGIMIRASSVVDNRALVVASQKLNLMLGHIPVVRQNLVGWGAELHIIGRRQKTSDLPEFWSMKGSTYKDNAGNQTNIDDRSRGMGNSIYVSCAEENLLNLPGDRYAGGQDICIHEFAHTIMDFGLDETIAKKIADQYHHAMQQSLWKGAYAAVNEGEYWAELSIWYFGKHGEYLPGTKKPEAGRKALQQYDPDGYALLDQIYSGKLASKKLNIIAPERLVIHTQSIAADQTAWLMVTNTSSRELTLDQEILQPYTSTIRPLKLNQVVQIGADVYKLTGPYCRLVIH